MTASPALGHIGGFRGDTRVAPDPSGAATESGFSDRHGFWGDDLDGPKNKPLPVFWGADSQISSKHSTSEDLMVANGYVVRGQELIGTRPCYTMGHLDTPPKTMTVRKDQLSPTETGEAKLYIHRGPSPGVVSR